MARSNPLELQPADAYDAINLARALPRLEAKILTSDPHSRLRYSSYERTKTAANLEYARTLLLRLEHSTSAVKTQSRKHAAQETLLQQRNLIKRLNDRLYELGQQQDDETWPSDASAEEDEDILAALRDPAPPTPETALARSPADAAQPQAQTIQSPLEPPEQAPNTTSAAAAPEPASTLRSRRPAQQPPSATTTGHTLGPSAQPSTTSFTPSSPLAPTTKKGNNNNNDPDPGATSLLESQTAQQTDLTTSLVDLASQLKASAQRFGASLALDTETLSKTESSLGRNKEGMDSAGRRMGTLRRMSEGRWWWGRMLLYAGIAALWCVAVLLVFGGPKLRF